MKVRITEVHELVGALKSQYIYQSSQCNKAKKEGKFYTPTFNQTGDLLCMLVDELEEVMQNAELLPASTKIELKCELTKKDESLKKKTQNEMISEIKMPLL